MGSYTKVMGSYTNGDYGDEEDDGSEEEEDPTPRRGRPPRHLQVSDRFRSPTLLLWGSIFGIMGFLLAFVIGVIRFVQNKYDNRGDEYPSGHGYWASTVSEMVHDWNSAQGRIFFGFCLISAFCIFQSWYPYELRNVFTGPDEIDFMCFKTYWITFRQLVPCVGLILLICVSTVPSQVANLTDEFAVVVHLLGAFMMFVGYIVAELKCLALCGFSGSVESVYLDIGVPEFRCRKVCMFSVLGFFVAFCVLQVVIMSAPTNDILCCHDRYEPIGTTDPFMPVNATLRRRVGKKGLVLMNTATGTYLIVKMASFMSEVIAGLALIGSHLVIWYYCEERHVEFGMDQLSAVYDEEGHKELTR